jgi:SMC interacting uncharacterized protein involved in chromosome segregation
MDKDKDKCRNDIKMVLMENNQEIICGIFSNMEKYLKKVIRKYHDSIQEKIKENDSEGIFFFTACLGAVQNIKDDLNVFFNEAKNIFEVENESI